ncbi:MAG: BNR repeat-containing protein [Niabella sp.]
MNQTAKNKHWLYSLLILLFWMPLCIHTSLSAQNIVNIAPGWASNSINTVVFRKNAVTTYKDIQFICYYDKDQHVVLGKRKLGSKQWELKQTKFKGNCLDAHRSISLIVDSKGFLHMSWNHHNNPLHYAKSKEPLSLELFEKKLMTGKNEEDVTYPEFYNLPDGKLLFFYRYGGSGKGNLVMNKYDPETQQWTQLYDNLIDGERVRNAYWQICIDIKGTIHLSWVWRESPDVASNHDMCYTRSTDGGITWEKSTGEKYPIPITASNAEYAYHIPQKSELINQTAMAADKKGNPYIVTYWRNQDSRVPQYRLIYHNGHKWALQTLAFRKTAFSLSGGGTKRIPISRPQVAVYKKMFNTCVAIIFRDEEKGSKISIAFNKNIRKTKWQVKDVLDEDLGSWEPSYDTELWKHKKKLHLFVQKTDQADQEGQSKLEPQVASVVEVKLK